MPFRLPLCSSSTVPRRHMTLKQEVYQPTSQAAAAAVAAKAERSDGTLAQTGRLVPRSPVCRSAVCFTLTNKS